MAARFEEATRTALSAGVSRPAAVLDDGVQSGEFAVDGPHSVLDAAAAATAV